MGERYLDAVEAGGSKPPVPTIRGTIGVSCADCSKIRLVDWLDPHYIRKIKFRC